VKDKDPAAVQQVACLSLFSSGRPVENCRYNLTKRYEGWWLLELREARTGRTLAVHNLQGSKDYPCPSTTFVDDGNNPPAHYNNPSVAGIQAVLR
jgi:hypothetical protein